MVKHGYTGTPEYSAWSSMKERCRDQRPHVRKYYLDKGITVCHRWLESFENFLADMGPKPGPEYSLDRIDGCKGYSPENCRWATLVEQNRNRSGARRLTINGEDRHVGEWAEISGVAAQTILARVKAGWAEDELLTPLSEEHKNRKELTYTYAGETRTLQEWAKHRGMSDETLRHRVQNRGWTIEDALTIPPNKKPRTHRRMITAFKKTLHIEEWVRESGIAASTIRMRLKKGWSAEDALTTPLQNNGRNTYK